MLRKISKLEIKTNERSYQFLCEDDAPVGEVYDTLSGMRRYVANIILENEKSTKEKEAENGRGNQPCAGSA